MARLETLQSMIKDINPLKTEKVLCLYFFCLFDRSGGLILINQCFSVRFSCLFLLFASEWLLSCGVNPDEGVGSVSDALVLMHHTRLSGG